MDPTLAMMAAARSEMSSELQGMLARNPALVRRLQKFSLQHLSSLIGGLLTLPENHIASGRLSSFQHMAVVCCSGTQEATLAQLREILNENVRRDAVAQLEDPVEDVCVSNVVTWFGNARLFEGEWIASDYSLEPFLAAMMAMKEDWMKPVLRSVHALLTLSEAAASRAGVERNTLAQGTPRDELRIVQSTAGVARGNVRFSFDELEAMQLGPKALEPFFFRPEMRDTLPAQTLGHTDLERHPLLHGVGEVVLMLPTAVSPAIRRFMIESAQAAGRLPALQDFIAKFQFSRVRALIGGGWKIRDLETVEENAPYEFVGTFDEGAYAHVVFLPDALEPILTEGIQSVDRVSDDVSKHADAVTERLSARADYQRGLTFIVHGGAGRGFAMGFGKSPPNWERVALNHSDFTLLTWDDEMTALRTWKLLDQEQQLRARGTRFVNLNGFLNLYGFADDQNFSLIPPELPASGALLTLATDYVTPLRHKLRRAIDKHGAPLLAPQGKPASFVEIQRQQTTHYFKEVKDLPIYVSVGDAISARKLACVQSPTRTWWVRCEQHSKDERASSVIYQVWQMALSWLAPISAALENDLPQLPAGPIEYQLAFPGVETFVQTLKREATETPPGVSAANGVVTITCSVDYLGTFGVEMNTGDRLMVEALIKGAYTAAGRQIEDAQLKALSLRIVRNDQARFFHTVPADSARQRLFSVLNEGSPRFVQPEDRALGWLNLATEAGWSNPPGSVAAADANSLLKKAAEVCWKRIKVRLSELERGSVAERAILNHYAVHRDSANWNLTAQAMLALYVDQADVIAAANDREGQRGVAGLTSRVIVEMAICVAPWGSGRACNEADLDYLMANLSVLLECASQSDALHYGLVKRALMVEPNGTFRFDTTFRDTLHVPYIHSHGERQFRNAAAKYAGAFEQRPAEKPELLEGFQTAFEAEFALTAQQLFQFSFNLADTAIQQQSPIFRLHRSEVLTRLKDVGSKAPERAYDALTLKPRKKWDEAKPKNAEARDWYPWRFNRRLSLTRRPLIQLNDKADPVVLIEPALFDRSVEFLFSTYNGRLPVELFESEEMRAWIGKAVNEEGHAFNKSVADAFKFHGFDAREINMTELGGTAQLGDVDAFAWNKETGVCYATECKRLLFARTVAEVGERLLEYTSVAAPGDTRTPIQKHVDRMSFLRANLAAVSKLTGIREDRIDLRSALVTDYLVPMQFSEDTLKFVDVVSDIGTLNKALGTKA